MQARRAQRLGTETAQQKSERFHREAKQWGKEKRERDEQGGVGHETLEQKLSRAKDRVGARVESAKPPAREMTTEQILKAAEIEMDWRAYKKAQDAVSHGQEKREAKISSLAGVKKAGLDRIERLAGRLAYLAAADKLAMWGMKKGKDTAVEGGKSLAAIGLFPVAALEKAGRRVAGTIQLEHALSERMRAEGMSSALKELPLEKRQDLHGDLLDLLSKKSRRASEEIVKGYEKIHKTL